MDQLELVELELELLAVAVACDSARRCLSPMFCENRHRVSCGVLRGQRSVPPLKRAGGIATVFVCRMRLSSDDG